MIRRCRMCNRPIKVTLWQWLTEPVTFCPGRDVSGCIATYKAMTEEPPEEPPFPDPQDEQPPDDLWTCPSCNGLGEVFVRKDWETGAWETEECHRCAGTGDLKVAPV